MKVIFLVYRVPVLGVDTLKVFFRVEGNFKVICAVKNFQNFSILCIHQKSDF